MAKNSRRRAVVLCDRREIAIDQRVRDALTLFPILPRTRLILSELREAQQSSGDESRSRGVAIAIEHAFGREVVPWHAVFGKLANHKVGDLLSCGQRAGIMRVRVGSSKSV